MKKNLFVAILIFAIIAVSLLTFTACGKQTVYTVDFEVDGETYASVEVAENATVAMPTDPEKSDYDFEGWYYDDDVFENKFSEEDVITSDVTLYAKWSLIILSFEGVSFEDGTVTYNGMPQGLSVEGVSEDATVEYSPAQSFTNVGTYEITATVTQERYETLVLTACLTIEKAVYDMSGITFEDKTYNYDETEKELVIDGSLPEGVRVEYADNKLTETGTTQAVATFIGDAENYEPIDDMTATLTVVYGPDYHAVTFNLPNEEPLIIMTKHGTAVKNVPVLPQLKIGYTAVWNIDLTEITEACSTYPIYKETEYHIYYDCGYGVNSEVNPDKYYISSDTIVFRNPTTNDTGRIFDGWFTGVAFEENTRIRSIPTGSVGDVKVYAKWIGEAFKDGLKIK